MLKQKASMAAKATMTLLFLAFMLLNFRSIWGQQLPSQDPGHKDDAEITGIKFSIPNDFNLETLPDSHIAFMRNPKYQLGLFVAVPETQVDEGYLKRLSNTLASSLLPSDKGFAWKVLPHTSSAKVSKAQTGSGNTKGYNKKKFLQTDYIILKTVSHTVLVGYITMIGKEENAKFLFDLDGPGGLSMPGWYAQAHVIASITGERYEEINSGTYIKVGPPTKKN